MNRKLFKDIFLECLRVAMRDIQSRCNIELPKKILVELHGASFAGDLMTADEAFEIIYISDEKYYKIVDIAVKLYTPSNTIFFVRISDNKPGDFSETLAPNQRGPFKILEIECSSLIK